MGLNNSMVADGNTCFRFFVPERNIRAQAQKRRNVMGEGGGGGEGGGKECVQ